MAPHDSATQSRRVTWTYALAGGLVSLPVTTAAYWQSGSELTLNAVFLGGLFAGVLAGRRGLSASRTGLRAGLVGSAPALWMAADLTAFVAGLAEPEWVRAVQLALVVGLVVLLVGLGALLGALGGRFGGWLVERMGA